MRLAHEAQIDAADLTNGARRLEKAALERAPLTRALRFPFVASFGAMGRNVVNLNRYRKKKQREAKAAQAELNRIRHGRTKAEKEKACVDRERAARLLDGQRLEGADAEGSAEEPPVGPPVESDPPD